MSYKWTIVIEIHPSLVADGIDLSKPDLVQCMLERAFPMAPMSGMTARVVKAPDPKRVRKEQGYKD